MRPLARVLTAGLAASVAFSQTASAFCGFYVATTDTPLINKASRVVLAHDGDLTQVTMASDVAGDPKEFGLVVPVPTVIKREQVKVINPRTVQHLAEYTKPRLVEYHDSDPCAPVPVPMPSAMAGRGTRMDSAMMPSSPPPTVRIEEQYSVEEYDIIVLTATNAADLVGWLNQSGYKIPAGAEATVGSYLRQGMHFFLAKVNMAKMKDNTDGFLRPIQVAYKSAKFMLPIRLGTVNARGPQDMIVLALTRKGRVETANYRTMKVPTGENIPLFVKARFGAFYDAMFDRQAAANTSATFLEYAWNLGNCDPCSSAPMASGELRALGAAWVPENGGMQPTFVTRLHVRYDAQKFPEDLALYETSDTESFQARYVMRHPFLGEATCQAGTAYKQTLPDRFRKEAITLQALTGWDMAAIRQDMRAGGQAMP